MSAALAPLERRVEHLDDVALMQQVAALDVRAFEALYDRHSVVAYSLAVRMLGSRSRADDVVQEAFLGLWRTAGRYDRRRGSPRTWILAMVHHRGVDALRRMGAVERRRAGEERLETVADGGREVLDHVAEREEARSVRSAMAGLTDPQRQVLELAYYGGWTQVEIAERLEVPLGTVKGRTRGALTALRDALGDLAPVR
jgi:RNA polymerase sigma-70 factor (ECF subfamily)